MKDRIICFDINKKKWAAIADDSIANEKLDKLPVMLFTEDDGLHLLWDGEDNKWKVVAWCEGIEAYTTDAKYVRGIPVLLSAKGMECDQLIPMFWLVKYLAEREAVFVGVEFVELRLKGSDVIPQIEKIHRSKYGNCTFKMRTGAHYVYKDYQTPPLEVVREAAQMMQVIIEKMYGRKTVLTEKVFYQKEFLEAFCFQPFEPQCYPLKKMISFWNEIPRDSSSVYECICGSWQISPPPKLKIIYRDFPQALPMYRILRELGFKDFSLIEKFFAIGKIGSLEMDDFVSMPVLRAGICIETDNGIKKKTETYDGDGAAFSQAEIDALLDGGGIDDNSDDNWNREIYYASDYKKWHWMKMLVSWMIKKRSEDVAAKHLINYSNNKPSVWLDDLSRIVRADFNDLPNEILEMILDKGYTREVYDSILKDYVIRKCVCR
ncbi:hypothetical protein SELR_13600 [Selenomonas ruminantium subsp. lactilytica TAM6421]|uniref:Uncharacterized protein n=1 Tax=Selenomonas ruminantium subsp. lactilytica (strain NBRC 103574 / TAM6421) TaxID=927704 RepID=I0GQN1_SELRL|nr:hypothetical protein [Selenomonas ruminantium]BAL83068.1 hypothetical protein SELR_13600 [Selenomonas ruminantium subsp. lactilytica TAM6421]